MNGHKLVITDNGGLTGSGILMFEGTKTGKFISSGVIGLTGNQQGNIFIFKGCDLTVTGGTVSSKTQITTGDVNISGGEFTENLYLYNSDPDTVVFLNSEDITRIYSENRKIMVCSEGKNYRSRQTLGELEGRLDSSKFIRISRFELVNIRMISGFDLSMAGTIKVSLKDGTETWVARRYVRAIQEKFSSINQGGKDHE